MSTRREFMQLLPAAGAAFAVARNLLEESPAYAQQIDPDVGHFHGSGKPPSKHTLDVLQQAKAALPFGDQEDFHELQHTAG